MLPFILDYSFLEGPPLVNQMFDKMPETTIRVASKHNGYLEK